MESLTDLEHEHGVWTWVQPPSPLTQVCAVTDDTTPRSVGDALAERFRDVPQFALLHLAAPEALRLEWVASCAAPVHTAHAPHAQSRIETLLALLAGPCRLAVHAVTKITRLARFGAGSSVPVRVARGDRKRCRSAG